MGGAVDVTSPGPVTRALLGMVRDDVDEAGMGERVCRSFVAGLDVDGAAISLLTRTESRMTLAVTDPVARLLEELQFSLNEGPCMEAAESGRPVVVADLGDTTRTRHWPLFAGEVASRTPVAALFAMPLRWGAVTIGVLDLYRRTPGSLTDEQWYDVAAAVDTAALLILGRRTGSLLHGPRGDADDAWLDQMSGHRAEIHQATGMVQVQLGVDSAEAVARMRGHAFAEHRLLIDVARDVVTRQLVFTEEMI